MSKKSQIFRGVFSDANLRSYGYAYCGVPTGSCGINRSKLLALS